MPVIRRARFMALELRCRRSKVKWYWRVELNHGPRIHSAVLCH